MLAQRGHRVLGDPPLGFCPQGHKALCSQGQMPYALCANLHPGKVRVGLCHLGHRGTPFQAHGTLPMFV